MRKTSDIQSTIAFVIGYGVVFYLLGLMMWPYLNTLVFAAMLSGSFYPMRTWFRDHWGIRPYAAASLTLLVIIVTLFLPSIYLVIGLSEEAVSVFNYLKETLTENFLEDILFGEGLFGNSFIPNFLEELFLAFNLEYNVATIQSLILDSAKFTSTYIINMANQLLGDILMFLFHLIILLVVIFAILLEGDHFKKFLMLLSPLPKEEEELMLEKFNQMNYATLVGNGLGGIIQGCMAGLGFWLVGFDSILLWTTTMVILAFIPMVGMSFVYVPAGIILLVQGRIVEGVILLIFCTMAALAVEQWFKPKFVGNRVQINSVLVFLSIVGGMSVFGFLGIFYGPLIISIFLTFVEIYLQRYGEDEGQPLELGP